jgi:hypothetical protein
MPDVVSAITMRLYLNVSPRRVSWRNPWGRLVSLDAGRGTSAAPCEELAMLCQKGLVEEVRAARINYEGELPWSTQRFG